LNVINFKIKGSWREVADSARTTVNMKPGTKEPTDSWKRKMLLAEHSPIRQMFISAKWFDLPYWVSVHFVRHKIGIEHWVRTQRSDRTGTERGASPQNTPVEHEILASYQAVITISRKRLCRQASPETQEAWKLMLDEVNNVDPVLKSVCVPECVYRGWCPEYKTCGYHKTEAFREALASYREGINSAD
jgi:hypothetical protein